MIYCVAFVMLLFTSCTKYDPLTGTEVEFIGSNMSQIAFDSPHADMNPRLGHDKPHIGVQTDGKRKKWRSKQV